MKYKYIHKLGHWHPLILQMNMCKHTKQLSLGKEDNCIPGRIQLSLWRETPVLRELWTGTCCWVESNFLSGDWLLLCRVCTDNSWMYLRPPYEHKPPRLCEWCLPKHGGFHWIAETKDNTKSILCVWGGGVHFSLVYLTFHYHYNINSCYYK